MSTLDLIYDELDAECDAASVANVSAHATSVSDLFEFADSLFDDDAQLSPGGLRLQCLMLLQVYRCHLLLSILLMHYFGHA